MHRTVSLFSLAFLLLLPTSAASKPTAGRTIKSSPAKARSSKRSKVRSKKKTTRAATTKRGLRRMSIGEGAQTRNGWFPMAPKTATAGKFSGELVEKFPFLRRGEQAILSVHTPVDDGVMLFVDGGTFQPLHTSYRAAGAYFERSDGLMPRSTAGFALNPVPLGGDDLKVDCRGHFPPNTLVSLIHVGGGKILPFTLKQDTMNGSAGKLKFFISTAGMNRGYLIVGFGTKKSAGHWRLDRCTIERDAP